MSAEKDDQEEDDDQLSAEAVSEDSYFDEEENEENYEIDFGEHYVTQIERLDLNVSQMRGKQKQWEVIKLRSACKIEGQQFGSIQCSQDEIIIFGSNFKAEFPTFSQIHVYKFNHELRQLTKQKELMNLVNGVRPDDEQFGMFQCGFYQDTITTFEGKIIAMP